jgi:hypothetical protein
MIKPKELICEKQRRDLLQERKKNKDLEKDLRDYEDGVMNGSALPKAVITRKSPESSPEAPKPKRIKTEERVIKNVDVGRVMSSQDKVDATRTLQEPANLVMTSAYNSQFEIMPISIS